MKLSRFLPIPALALFGTGVGFAQATLTDMGGSSPRPVSMSSDGVWVAGFQPSSGFRWSSGTGFQSIAIASNGFPDVALTGSPFSATMVNPGGNQEAAQWTPGGVTFIGGLGGQSGTSISSVYAASDDGSTVVGLGWISAGQAHAFKWTLATGMVDLLSQNPTRSSRANGVSGDGSLVVGWDEDLTGFRRPAAWPGAVGTWLSANPGEAWDANTDGSVVVGVDNGELFRWTQATGLVHLGKAPASLPDDDCSGLSVSADGNTIVGSNGDSFFGTPFRAVIWRPGAGIVVLKDLLVALGAPNAATAELSFAQEVSADGKTIAIAGGQAPFGPFKGWIATLPDVASVYCTAKTNSQGCVPAIAFAGTPSASSGSGFTISASNLLSNVSGLLIYSTTGAASQPFQGGTLCLASPVRRTAGQNSGGAGACGGSLALDFNAQVALGQDPALIGGAKVWAQIWSRDSGFAPPNNTNLTDALSFTLWP
jgi:probable HAF family extracellular repeat protein